MSDRSYPRWLVYVTLIDGGGEDGGSDTFAATVESAPNRREAIVPYRQHWGKSFSVELHVNGSMTRFGDECSGRARVTEWRALEDTPAGRGLAILAVTRRCVKEAADAG